MKISRCAATAVIAAVFATSALAGTHSGSPQRPFRNTATRGGYIIETAGVTLDFGPDKKIVQLAQIALVDKTGALINPFLLQVDLSR